MKAEIPHWSTIRCVFQLKCDSRFFLAVFGINNRPIHIPCKSMLFLSRYGVYQQINWELKCKQKHIIAHTCCIAPGPNWGKQCGIPPLYKWQWNQNAAIYVNWEYKRMEWAFLTWWVWFRWILRLDGQKGDLCRLKVSMMWHKPQIDTPRRWKWWMWAWPSEFHRFPPVSGRQLKERKTCFSQLQFFPWLKLECEFNASTDQLIQSVSDQPFAARKRRRLCRNKRLESKARSGDHPVNSCRELRWVSLW